MEASIILIIPPCSAFQQSKLMAFVDVLGGGIGDMEAFNASISRAMGSGIRGLLLVLSEVTTRYFTGEDAPAAGNSGFSILASPTKYHVRRRPRTVYIW